ncbi:olfactory receptor 8G50-like [Gastrophryne carolinensis]
MQNDSILTEFFLSGLSDLPSLQLPLFLFFLLIYILIITWNFVIISLIATNSRLHTPMYFFLGNLAGLDLCSSSVTLPRMLSDLYTGRRVITYAACLTQFYIFFSFASGEVFLLSLMSYDRYVAICHPLHYMQMMGWRVCIWLASFVWCFGFIHSSFHAFCAWKLLFCENKNISSFFCDLPQLFQISCSDIFINVILVLFFGVLLGGGSLVVTFLAYLYIFRTVLKMQVKGSRRKVFSTCSSHLTVVFIFFGSVMFNYFSPGANSYYAGNKVVAVFYTTIVPLLNPLIYSLRNQDFRASFQNLFIKINGILKSAVKGRKSS